MEGERGSEAAPLLQENPDPDIQQQTDSLHSVGCLQHIQVEGSDQTDGEFSIKFYSEQILLLFLPLLATFVLVCWLETTLNINDQQLQEAVLYYHEDPNDDTATRLGGSILNALLILFGIVVVTLAFVVCFYFRWYKLIYLWLGFSICSILGVTTSAIWIEMMDRFRLPLDWITMSFVTWNFMLVGLIAIFGRSPLWLQQAYLVIVSAVSAISLLRLPSWTTWTVLNMVAIYDIIAVLCPAGPLRLLIDMAVERGEDIPALIYTAGMADFDRHNRNGESGIMGISTRENFDLSTNQNQNVRNAFFSGTVRNIMRRDGYEPVVVSDEDQRDDDEMIVEGERNINSEIESESYRDCPRVGDDEPADDLYDGRASRTDAVTLTICTMAVLTVRMPIH
ncbi:Presenilin-domain-containing protein [Jimgerdemannia flammicorona]|uniref:Presenilin n=1 Tax=Jimgerdemannia flammicorona TaxID=994334 RepID=A0A433Q9X6_9FUNG|nr:Presenilin-domain-containing protein [Jimgerdemannia flammicorona]